MIQTIRINIPYSETESMYKVLENKLSEIGLKLSDIQTHFKSRSSNESQFGNWCYVGALDIPELHKTDMLLDLPQCFLEVKDLDGLNVGDRVEYTFSNAFLWENSKTGRIFKIRKDGDLAVIEVSQGKSKVKGFRFYTGDNVKIKKIK
jgi:hypothetical protein